MNIKLPVDIIKDVVPELFEKLEGNPYFQTLTEFTPKYPQYSLETLGNQYKYRFDIPGVIKEDIVLSERDNILTIKFERKEEKSNALSNYTYTESKYGSFSRDISLEKDALANEMKASLRDGVLTVTVGRNTDEQQERNITIE